MGSRNISPCILGKQDLLPLCLHFTPSTLGFAWILSDYPLAHTNSSGQFCLWIPDLLVCVLVVKSCPALWDPMDCSTLGFPYPSLSPRVCSNSCPLSQWCYPPISSSVVPFSCCPQFFPASRSFPMSWLFASGGQSIGASASVLPMNILDWFPLGLTGLISLLSKGLSRVFSSTTIQKHQFFLVVYLPPLSVSPSKNHGILANLIQAVFLPLWP